MGVNNCTALAPSPPKEALLGENNEPTVAAARQNSVPLC